MVEGSWIRECGLRVQELFYGRVLRMQNIIKQPQTFVSAYLGETGLLLYPVSLTARRKPIVGIIGGNTMATIKNKIVPHLWFDKEAIEAARFYTSAFKDSRIISISTLQDTPSGAVDVVTFELFGQEFMAISAGPLFKFNESISFTVKCDTQEEIDYYWDKLTSDGGQEIECGWLKR